MINSSILDRRSQSHMIGLLVRNTSLLAKYKLTEKDFLDLSYETKHPEDPETKITVTIPYQEVFKCIETKYYAGKLKLETGDVPDSCNEWVKKWADRACIDNIDYYYNSLRKTTVLRESYLRGYSMDEYLWHIWGGEKRKEAFDKASLDELIRKASEPMGQLIIEQNYGLDKCSWDSDCGTPESYLREYLSTPAWGVTTVSPLLNSMIHGWCRNTFYEIIASSGAGKSMMSYSSIGYGYLKYFSQHKKWEETGNKQSCLYIGTEMDIANQVIP